DNTRVARRLWEYLRSHWRMLLGVLVMLLLGAVGQATAPALIGSAVDQYITQGDRAGLQRTMFLLLGAYLIQYVSFTGQAYLMGIISQRVLRELRLEIFEHIQRLSLRYFDRHETGDLMSRLVNDTEVIGNTLSQTLIQTLGALFGLVGIVIAMFLLNWQLALAAFLIIPVMFATTRIFSSRARVAFRATRETIGDVSSSLQEDIGSVREAQAFNRTGQNIERFEQANAANRDANVRAGGITAAFGPAIDVLSTVATAIVAGVGGWLAFRDVVSVGVVVAFLAYADRFFRPVQQISALYTQMQATFAASERIFELLDTEPELVDRPGATLLPPIEGYVTFDQVDFGYEPGRLVLRDITFEARPGQTIALVGPTGAGKSTLVNLIGRFYDVTAGRVRIDGYDVRDVTRHSLRSQMGVVPQDAFLFAGSVADNVRYGKQDATMDEVIAASKAAHAHDFIVSLPAGYETRLGERGGTLSQGQRQLLAIARAILANPPLLILDEATASVDTRTERLIQSALKQLLRPEAESPGRALHLRPSGKAQCPEGVGDAEAEGAELTHRTLTRRTAFVIAHRLSTIRNADLILVLQDGRIVERGPHDALLAQGGLYSELYRRQIRPAA
ncbi:MAG: ABC transporter ATP-binding protein, partial [Ardenticatenaceae bacterium]